MEAETKVLLIGATGGLGTHMAKASAAAGHPTFVLVRTQTLSDPAKSGLLDSFRELGITVLEGSLEDHQSLVDALKKVDVIISTVSGSAFHTQFALLPAIKEAGTIKRFFPSEFGLDVDRVTLLPPVKKHWGLKRDLRREIEQAKIPFTYVNSVAFAKVFLASLWQLGKYPPPRDIVEMFGDGEGKVSFVDEGDVAAYTIKAMDDPRTLNKILSIRPELISPNEVVALWEKKIGHTLEKTYLTEEKLMKKIEELARAPLAFEPGQRTPPLLVTLCIKYCIFIEAGTSFEATPNYVEAHELYPAYKFVTVDDYLNQFL